MNDRQYVIDKPLPPEESKYRGMIELTGEGGTVIHRHEFDYRDGSVVHVDVKRTMDVYGWMLKRGGDVMCLEPFRKLLEPGDLFRLRIHNWEEIMKEIGDG